MITFSLLSSESTHPAIFITVSDCRIRSMCKASEIAAAAPSPSLLSEIDLNRLCSWFVAQGIVSGSLWRQLAPASNGISLTIYMTFCTTFYEPRELILEAFAHSCLCQRMAHAILLELQLLGQRMQVYSYTSHLCNQVDCGAYLSMRDAVGWTAAFCNCRASGTSPCCMMG